MPKDDLEDFVSKLIAKGDFVAVGSLNFQTGDPVDLYNCNLCKSTKVTLTRNGIYMHYCTTHVDLIKDPKDTKSDYKKANKPFAKDKWHEGAD